LREKSKIERNEWIIEWDSQKIDAARFFNLKEPFVNISHTPEEE
jgi:hypothetical protein